MYILCDLVGQMGVEGIEPTRCRSHEFYRLTHLLSGLYSQEPSGKPYQVHLSFDFEVC